ncbi:MULTISPECIES: winged helix-turn-helix transcriptional regulator [Actinomycetes]|uniref:Transcriptional regulator, HxlR family n=4 Tax=Actinomycetes TaxID=1760 RepID=A0A2H1IE99_BRELN|nr:MULTISPECIES: helix-turn-helix domain-containing protein [Actinomycetes]MDN5585165.1 helix-turn-helix transcriptional regulator [Brevibacterium sp.]MDN5726383.1 helix-turn-helix transcriptional regulator [Propionibacteriales bacterium]AHI20896.1 HxlR family transcriptional regulator [Corynebacterium casei LMG S-19264]SMX69612.1 transcriptional regulator, HxlR family [Brevibacterium antiquum]SMX73454.1 transcriptional regulator, HxlR family [Brevibacterium linens ATCC 9172]
MPLRSDWSHDACSIARGVQAVGDPWVLLILRELVNGQTRFDALRERLGIADNTLAARLKSMTEAGLVTRHPYHDGRRTRYEYQPTEAAKDALPILHAFSLWAGKHATGDADREIEIVCRACGTHSTMGERCSACGSQLTVATTAWIRPSSTDRTPVPLAG